jgi:hypothetical protein
LLEIIGGKIEGKGQEQAGNGLLAATENGTGTARPKPLPGEPPKIFDEVGEVQ